MLGGSAVERDLVGEYFAFLRVERGLSANTLSNYTHDLNKLRKARYCKHGFLSGLQETAVLLLYRRSNLFYINTFG